MWSAENAPFLPHSEWVAWLQVFETLVKNCGDSVHQQIAEKDVLHEMVKIVKKKVSTVIVFYQVPVYYFLSSLCQDCS
jgi:hypothetical protein